MKIFYFSFSDFKKGENMDGVIIVNKPKGFTSNDIVQKIRKIDG